MRRERWIWLICAVPLLLGGVMADAIGTQVVAATDPVTRAKAVVAQMSMTQEVTEMHADGSRNVPGIASLGIPAMPYTNGPAGVTNGLAGRGPTTALPSPISLAATWDPSAAAAYGDVMGIEARGQAYALLEGPDVNLPRVQRGGRTFEMLGEDPVLSGTLAGAEIQAMQSHQVMADIKHYVGNDQETNRFGLNDVVDERTLRELYLYAFEIGVKQGDVDSVMCAYPQINGSFSCGNAFILNQVLKGEWSFPGFVMTDFGAAHSVTDVTNGLDMCSPSAGPCGSLPGPVSKSRIDDALVRRFSMMMRRGIWDSPPTSQTAINFGPDQQAALQIEEGGEVLLKNDTSLLPLRASSLHSIALIGPGATAAVTGGGGSSHVSPQHTVSPSQGIHDVAPGLTVTVDSGTNAAAVARAADVAVVMVDNSMGEGHDITSTALPSGQDAIVTAAAAANPRTIVVVKTGTSALMPWVNQVHTVLWTGYPGEMDGDAVANVLFGNVDPSGHLPITFPVSESQVPQPASPAVYSEKLNMGYRGFDANSVTPLFPFGYGLSYTTFSYSSLSASGDTSGASVTFDVTNTGTVAGSAVPQVYLGFPGSAGEPPELLRGYQKVMLSPGQTRAVTINLAARDFQWWDTATSSWTTGPASQYRVMLATSAAPQDVVQTVALGAGCPPSGATGPATALSGTANGGGQISATWTPPASGGCVAAPTAYAIYLVGADGSTQMQESTGASFQFTGLSPNTYYTFTVTAWNGAGWSAWAGWAPWVLAT